MLNTTSHKLQTIFIRAASCAIVLGMALSGAVKSASASMPQSRCELVVLAQSDDPYYPLAVEIAAAEKAPVAHSLSEAMACQPVFLLWVVSPTSLSDASLIEFGLATKDRSAAISSGILTASTFEQARALWKRRTQVRGQSFFAVNAPNPAAHIDEGRIIAFSQGQTTTQALTKTRFQDALRTADYLTFTGHGGNKYLKLDENTPILAEDVPALNSVVVATGSCQTLRPWNPDSIARRFVDQGAAAYSGFVFSPNEGYLIGEFDGLPFRYTWPDFPIGHVIQVQNRGTLQGFALFPYQHLLGDPRLALQTQAPYRLVEDYEKEGFRVLTFRDVPAGVIPIRIAGGAAYRFVEIPGVTAADEQDPFYNSRLQMVNIQNDKFILLVHTGGELTVYMRRQAPWYWFPADILLDSLDDTILFSPQTGGDYIAIAFAIIPLIWVGWQVLKKRLGWPALRIALVIGVGAAALHGFYALVRLDHVTITSKAVAFSPLSLVAVFLLSACGALIYLHARSPIGKLAALLVTTFVSWSPMVLGLAMVGAFNRLAFMPKMGVALYNYALGLLPAASFLTTFALAGLVLWTISRTRNLEPRAN